MSNVIDKLDAVIKGEYKNNYKAWMNLSHE